MTTFPKKICVVTGTRAEYGLLYNLIKLIQSDQALHLQLLVTGMHLSPEFGLTYKQIEADQIPIEQKIEILLSSDTPVAISKTIGLATISFAEAYERLKPDLLVLLGDRFEILAAAQAAMTQRIPIAHIHGGELTEGLIDEPIRHSVTKMSHLHFTAADQYRRRVIQMGEQPDRVFDVGAVGIDNVKQLKLLSRSEFESAIDFGLGTKSLLVTYHPVTLENQSPELAMNELLGALEDLREFNIIFTLPNADTQGRCIIDLINRFVEQNASRSKAFVSLGQLRYLSAINHVDVVVGNSSSGLIEVPVFKKPTINIGDRQRGRLKSLSVIDCAEIKSEISKAIHKAMSPEFQKALQSFKSVYGDGGASKKILDIIKSTNLDGIIKKKFYDMEIL